MTGTVAARARVRHRLLRVEAERLALPRDRAPRRRRTPPAAAGGPPPHGARTAPRHRRRPRPHPTAAAPAAEPRSALLVLGLVGPTLSGTELVAELATQPRALRRGDVVAALCADLPHASAGRVCRIRQFTDADAMRREPLPSPPGLDGWSLAAASAPDHTEGLSDVRRTEHPLR